MCDNFIILVYIDTSTYINDEIDKLWDFKVEIKFLKDNSRGILIKQKNVKY
ncbi:MAG: hypothetical protein Q8835_03480 [Sweet potato little leaf phytoplasma]|nr:hypothetical protein [Sweet potato little leaf phytoplasma]